jgi:uncharacterized membrane-anchored protein YhcB (DUF1043 family)
MQDIFIYASLLIVGVIIGVVITKIAVKDNSESESVAQKEQATAMTHAQLREQLLAANQTLDDFESQIELFKNHLTEIDYILTSHEQSEDQPRITFFGEHASPYIRMSQKTPKEQANPEHQPRDFSNSSSGLFVGESTEKAK